MTFISYAQNFEDVMLWRALKHVENGFYIDIGAQDPIVDSVSLAFYEHGWRGFHVEPTKQYASKLRHARPDERVFQVAIGSGGESITFFEFFDTGLSTADFDLADSHQKNGFDVIETVVPVLSLDQLLAEAEGQDIHWLKIDVEGFEARVLESWKQSTLRPWVLVIESTKPLSQELNHLEWDELVVRKGYVFVHFDGVNRFYVSNQHPEVIEAFQSPPNIFDNFVLNGTASQPFCRLIESNLKQAEKRAEQAEKRAEQAEIETALISKSLNAIYISKSWRLTSPLRWIVEKIRKMRAFGFKITTKKIFKKVIKSINMLLWRAPSLRRFLVEISKKIGIYSRLRLELSGLRDGNLRDLIQCDAGYFGLHQTEENLSPRGKEIYKKLKEAVNQKKRERDKCV